MIKFAVIGSGIQGLFSCWKLSQCTGIEYKLFDINFSRFGGSLSSTSYQTSFGPINFPNGCHYFPADSFSPLYQFLSDVCSFEELHIFKAKYSSVQGDETNTLHNSIALPIVNTKLYKPRNDKLNLLEFRTLYELDEKRFGSDAAHMLDKKYQSFANISSHSVDVFARFPLQSSRIFLDQDPILTLKLKNKSNFVDEDIAVPKHFLSNNIEHDSLIMSNGLQNLFDSAFIAYLKDNIQDFLLTPPGVDELLSNVVNGERFDLILYTGSPFPFFKNFNLLSSQSSSLIYVYHFICDKEFEPYFHHDFSLIPLTRLSLQPINGKTCFVIECHNKPLATCPKEFLISYLNTYFPEYLKAKIQFVGSAKFPSYIYPSPGSTYAYSCLSSRLKQYPSILMQPMPTYSKAELIAQLDDILLPYL